MNALRRALILLPLVLAQSVAFSAGAVETPEATRANVLSVVQRFLDALGARDPVAMKATVTPEGQIQAMTEGPDGNKMTFRLLGDFADRLATGQGRLLERIWNPTVLIEGRIATVWAPYDLYRDGKFSHSGIDVFMLMRIEVEWKIVNVAYNAQPQVPSRHPDGPPRH